MSRSAGLCRIAHVDRTEVFEIPVVDSMLTYKGSSKISAVCGSASLASHASSFYLVGIVAVFSAVPTEYDFRDFLVKKIH